MGLSQLVCLARVISWLATVVPIIKGDENGDENGDEKNGDENGEPRMARTRHTG